MLGTRTDALDTAGAEFMTVVGLGCAWWGCLVMLRPHRPPLLIEGPVWVVRVWRTAYVLLGVCMAVRMTAMLVGEEPAWPMIALQWVAGPLLVCSVTAAGVSLWRARRRVAEVKRPVSWGEAALVTAACWAVSGVGYGVLAALDEPAVVRGSPDRHGTGPLVLRASPLLAGGCRGVPLGVRRAVRARGHPACELGSVRGGRPRHGGRVHGGPRRLHPGRSGKPTPPRTPDRSVISDHQPPGGGQDGERDAGRSPPERAS